MKFVLFYHSLVSCWNHGNAHFLRGIATALGELGHQVEVFEPADGWSLANLRREQGEAALAGFAAAYPRLHPRFYDPATLDPGAATEGADVVIVHEWNDPALVRALGRHRAGNPGYRLLFHDTHHRAVSDPEAIARFDLRHYDGVLAFGRVLREVYLERGWAARAWTWHEAADIRVFRPRPPPASPADLVWIGNWGDEERTTELREFLLDPVARLGLSASVHGVRYPATAQAALRAAGIVFRGWLPNHAVPEVFARHRVTLHIPRRPYALALPGIPTIRPFEALACGIPLVSAPWDDCEGLFTAGQDFLPVHNGREMADALRAVLDQPALARSLAEHGLATVRSRHTCRHRAAELLGICRELGLAADGGNGLLDEGRNPPRPPFTEGDENFHERGMKGDCLATFTSEVPPMRPHPAIAFFGSSLVSSYWNGAATYYRGLLGALSELGYRIEFFEPDAFERQAHRDIADPPWARVTVYPATETGVASALEAARRADIVVKASGVGVFDGWLEREVPGLRAPDRAAIFWDVDAPATLERVRRDPHDPFPAHLPHYDLVLTYGGGPLVISAYLALGARHCVPVYNALDPATHFPVPPDPAFAADLSFLGNRLPDREARVHEFFFKPAALCPGQRCLLGGSGWDEAAPALPNLRRAGHVYTHQHNAFNCSTRLVLNINRAGMARFGHSPATRIFEAAGAGACLVTDAWEGIGLFLEPGREILVAESGEEVAAYLRGISAVEARAIGAAARRRVTAQHTYARRAAQVDAIFRGRLPGVRRLAAGAG